MRRETLLGHHILEYEHEVMTVNVVMAERIVVKQQVKDLNVDVSKVCATPPKCHPVQENRTL